MPTETNQTAPHTNGVGNYGTLNGVQEPGPATSIAVINPATGNRATQLAEYLAHSYEFHLFMRLGGRSAQISEGGYGIMMANSSDVALQVLTRFILPVDYYVVASLILGLGDALATAFAVGHDANTKNNLIAGVKSYGEIKRNSTKWWIGAFVAVCATAYFYGALSPIIGLFSADKDQQGCAQNVAAGIKILASYFTISQFLLYVFVNTTSPKKAAEVAQKLFARLYVQRTAAAVLTIEASPAAETMSAAAPLMTQAETGPSLNDYFCEANKIHWLLAAPSCISRGLIFAFSGLKFATLIFCVAPSSALAISLAAIAGTTAILMNLFTTVMFNLELNAQKSFETRTKISLTSPLAGTPTALSSAAPAPVRTWGAYFDQLLSVAGTDNYGWVSNYPRLLVFTQLLNIPASWLSFLSKAVGTGDFLLEVATLAGTLDLSKKEDLQSYTALGLVIGGVMVGAIANWQWRTQCVTMGYKGAPRTLQTVGEDLYWASQKVWQGAVNAGSQVAEVFHSCSASICPSVNSYQPVGPTA